MRIKAVVAILVLGLSGVALSQSGPQKSDDQTIRISTELVQLDVVVTDKKGRVVSGLNKEDFELFENGKKQQISFFEFVTGGLRAGAGKPGEEDKAAAPELSPQGPGIGDVKRIFAFVIDDLTIRHEDLTYIRQMLSNFVENRMQPTDLVAIVRTIGGKGLLQQFTTDKALLKRAIAALTPRSHPLKLFNTQAETSINDRGPQDLLIGSGGTTESTREELASPFDASTFDVSDLNVAPDDSRNALRAFMSLGTASFVIDSMRELPGRKSLVLVSGGLPVLSSRPGSETGIISHFVNSLSDRATRAGVTIHTMDIRGLEAQRAVASFEDTPAKSMISMPGSSVSPATGGAFGRIADESLLGTSPIELHQSLRILASATGGLAILNKNNFDEGIEDILSASEGYYLLAYTPTDSNFDNKFRELKVKVKGGDYKIYSRKGYFAREDRRADTSAASKQEQILAAIRSPLARRDINLDATMLYKAAPPDQGTIDIHLVIDPKKLHFEKVDGKNQTSIDVAGFVFDEFGRLRGGFNETINASLTEQELARVSKGGLTYSANTKLPAGSYQVRLAVRDNKNNGIGTMSRYLEVPDLSKGRLAASSLLLAAVAPGDTKATNPTPISANRQIPRSQDLRYATIIYNAKQKDGKPQVRSQLIISQGGKVIFKEPEEMVPVTSGDQLIKWGQLGLKGVKPGRYTLTLVITDTLADKKANTISRSMDFIVVD